MRLDSDLAAVHFLARYARRLARVAVLRPSARLIREFTAVVGPSLYCRPKLVWDQDGVPFAQDGSPCPHPPPCDTCTGASVLRLQFWPVRVWLLDGDQGAATRDREYEGVSLLKLERQHRHAAAAVWLSSRPDSDPCCIVDVSNSLSTSGVHLSDKSRRKLRRVLNPHALKGAGPELAFLRARRLYVEEWTNTDDIIAQVTLALLQFVVVDTDSDLSAWMRESYPSGVRLEGVSPQRRFHNRGAVFEGAWKNWGEHDRAGAWRTYLGVWFRTTGRSAPRRGHVRDGDLDDVRPVGVDDPDSSRSHSDWLEIQSGLSPARRQKRNVAYSVPPDEPLDPAVPIFLDKVARVLGLSQRQVRRLVDKGDLQPIAGSPLKFAAEDVERLRDQRLPDVLERRRRKRAIGELVLRGKELASARKAEYRQRKRRQAI